MYKRYLAFVSLALWLNSFMLATPVNPNKEHTVTKNSHNIVVDGVLDEPFYALKPIDGFTQRDPSEGEPATEKTHAWITYDDHALYISAYCYDSAPDSIRTGLTRRDSWSETDWFIFFVDPYLDKNTGYYFAVNPSGSIVDGTLYNDSWDDNVWNGIWESKARITKEGWTLEMKIPFSQLRFNDAAAMTWGFNIKRTITRKAEQDYYVLVPKKEAGFVSKFALLNGLQQIPSPSRLEVLPYFVSKAQYLKHETGDPFYKHNQYSGELGADVKYGITSNLTLDLTINPDFGQVEVDPAVVNLTAFETFYDEKRPFFIEGSESVMFGFGGSNNNWGFNWMNPMIFYSRRIGKAPGGDVSSPDGSYTDYPAVTRILAAAKITGKISDKWSVYGLNATTERTFATLHLNGNEWDEEIEPLTNYSVLRMQRSFDDGFSGLGFIGTSVIRDLRTVSTEDRFASRSFSGGVDGWIHLDEEKTYVLTAYGTGSYTAGSQNYITSLQESSVRYLQRPDRQNYRIDSAATELGGFAGRITLNKQKGDFYLNTALGVITPGYQINDIGFQSRASTINGHLVLGYRFFETDGFFKRKNFYLSYFRTYDFDGNLNNASVMAFANAQLEDYSGINIQGGYDFEGIDTRLTRGGVAAKRPSAVFGNLNYYTDFRKHFVVEPAFGFYAEPGNSNNYWGQVGFRLQVGDPLNITVSPGIEINNDVRQWVTNVDDASATKTYGQRNVFGELKQETYFAIIRLDWAFSPVLSVQAFIQPLISYGSYSNFKELSSPNSNEYLKYGTAGTSIRYNENDAVYEVKPDPKNPSNSFSVDNPDFNFKSIRANFVVRWEFMPGSALYLVWTHDKQNFENPSRHRIGHDFSSLMQAEPDNVFMLKFSYWFSM